MEIASRLPTKTAASDLGSGRHLVFADSNVEWHELEHVTGLGIADAEVQEVEVGPKDPAALTAIWTKLVECQPLLVVAVGGGTLCDLVGFAAATFNRGTPHVLIPTTTISMIDAAIGGKTGIDLGGAKNAVGAMWPARHVLVATSFLGTVPAAVRFDGLVEAVKLAALYDANLFGSLERGARHLAGSTGSDPWIAPLYAGAVALKARLTEDPETRRTGLLYGHNIGHAIEALSGGATTHARAVAVGLTLEGALAVIAGALDEAVWRRQTALIAAIQPGFAMRELDLGRIIEAMAHSRLSVGDELLFVVPAGLGGRVTAGGGYLHVRWAWAQARLAEASEWVADRFPACAD